MDTLVITRDLLVIIIGQRIRRSKGVAIGSVTVPGDQFSESINPQNPRAAADAKAMAALRPSQPDVVKPSADIMEVCGW